MPSRAARTGIHTWMKPAGVPRGQSITAQGLPWRVYHSRQYFSVHVNMMGCGEELQMLSGSISTGQEEVSKGGILYRARGDRKTAGKVLCQHTFPVLLNTHIPGQGLTTSLGKYWTTDGISNISYKRKDRLVTFSLDTFGPITLMQDTHINMPYQSWELRPLESNTVLLTVTTVFTEVQIKIKENLCMLASIKLKDRKHLSVLEGKWMTPIPFINALKEAGVNIFPSEYSHFYVVMNNKVPVVEMKAYRQIALLSPAFAFAWSRWNMLCNSTKVVFKVKEYLTEAAAESPKWDLLLFSGERAQRLKMDEDSESFSEALKDDTEFHSTVFHMVKDFASKEAMEVVGDPPCLLVDAVCHMLFSTRVLSYS